MGSSFASNTSLLDPDPVGSGPDAPPSSFRFNPMRLFNVEGLVAVVTGGGTGIGLMMAAALENNGATVYIVGRRLDVLHKAAVEASRFGKMIPLEGDITKKESLLAIVEAVKARHGYIDLLVNNAGIARNLYTHPLPDPSTSPPASHNHPPSPPASPAPGHAASSVPSIKAFQTALWETGSIDDWEDTFRTNVTAVYYTTIAFLELLHQGNVRRQRFECGLSPASSPSNSGTGTPALVPDLLSPPSLSSTSGVCEGLGRGGYANPPHHTSQVISVSSSGSFRLDSKVLSPSYTLSKSACTHLGKLMANLLSPWGIRSNVLAPGVWPSEMTVSTAPGVTLDPIKMANGVPLRRPGSEDEMAGTILFLASGAGAYVNGAVWLVDGGRVGTVASCY